ncbi:MAG TPA: hypothetical protein VE110_03780 [Gemmatimonadaceae bacterium]|nr:hypothetical protein [Gemmatimonadaceae bacterium]
MNRFLSTCVSARGAGKMVAALSVATLFAACTSIYDKTSFSTYVAGSYALETISGAALPVVLPQMAPGKSSLTRVYSGTLALTIDGQFTLQLAESDAAASVPDPTPFKVIGNWEVNTPSTITLDGRLQDPTLVFPTDLAGTGVLEFDYLGGRFHFAKP